MSLVSGVGHSAVLLQLSLHRTTACNMDAYAVFMCLHLEWCRCSCVFWLFRYSPHQLVAVLQQHALALDAAVIVFSSLVPFTSCICFVCCRVRCLVPGQHHSLWLSCSSSVSALGFESWYRFCLRTDCLHNSSSACFCCSSACVAGVAVLVH
jgi:hypothetical protein